MSKSKNLKKLVEKGIGWRELYKLPKTKGKGLKHDFATTQVDGMRTDHWTSPIGRRDEKSDRLRDVKRIGVHQRRRRLKRQLQEMLNEETA